MARRRVLEMGDEEGRKKRQAVVVLLTNARKSMAMASKLGLLVRRRGWNEDDGRACCGSKDEEDNSVCCLCATKDLLSSSIYVLGRVGPRAPVCLCWMLGGGCNEGLLACRRAAVAMWVSWDSLGILRQKRWRKSGRTQRGE